MPRIAALAAACLLAAAVSMTTPSVPTTDPWGWIVWGREVAHLDLDTSAPGAPSWKPLPVLITTPLAVFGDAEPDLWMVVARGAGLFGLCLAALLAAELAGPLAGALAIGGLVLSNGWLRGMLHGYSEPLGLALLAGAALLHLRGRRGWVLALLVLAGLGRPEVWPVIGLYAMWGVWRREIPIGAAAGMLVTIPILWFGGDLWGSGDALHGSQEAAAISRMRGDLSYGDLLSLAFGGGLVVLPVFGLAALLLPPRDRPTLALGGIVAGFFLYLWIFRLLGYSASARFLEPGVEMLCVMAGVGGARLAHFERGGLAGRVAGLAVVLAGVTVLVAARGITLDDQVRGAHDRALLQHNLQAAVNDLGPERLLACGAPVLPADLAWNEPALAWTLERPINDVRKTSARGAVHGRSDLPAVVIAPAEKPITPSGGVRLERLAQRRGWRFYRSVPPRAGPGRTGACPLERRPT
jgi:hypothetical protein